MGVADVTRAFNAGLNGAATCTGTTMDYLQAERKQRLTFTVMVNGTPQTVTEDVAPGVDLAKRAKEVAADFAANLGD